MLAATHKPKFPVDALQSLFTHDPKSPDSPLFTFTNASFSRRRGVEQLRALISALDIPSVNYSGNSFRKGAAQHAVGNGMLEDDIQKLDRWSSESFRLYFATSTQTLYNLNMNFRPSTP